MHGQHCRARTLFLHTRSCHRSRSPRRGRRWVGLPRGVVCRRGLGWRPGGCCQRPFGWEDHDPSPPRPRWWLGWLRCCCGRWPRRRLWPMSWLAASCGRWPWRRLWPCSLGQWWAKGWLGSCSRGRWPWRRLWPWSFGRRWPCRRPWPKCSFGRRRWLRRLSSSRPRTRLRWLGCMRAMRAMRGLLHARLGALDCSKRVHKLLACVLKLQYLEVRLLLALDVVLGRLVLGVLAWVHRQAMELGSLPFGGWWLEPLRRLCKLGPPCKSSTSAGIGGAGHLGPGLLRQRRLGRGPGCPTGPFGAGPFWAGPLWAGPSFWAGGPLWGKEPWGLGCHRFWAGRAPFWWGCWHRAFRGHCWCSGVWDPWRLWGRSRSLGGCSSSGAGWLVLGRCSLGGCRSRGAGRLLGRCRHRLRGPRWIDACISCVL